MPRKDNRSPEQKAFDERLAKFRKALQDLLREHSFKVQGMALWKPLTEGECAPLIETRVHVWTSGVPAAPGYYAIRTGAEDFYVPVIRVYVWQNKLNYQVFGSNKEELLSSLDHPGTEHLGPLWEIEKE